MKHARSLALLPVLISLFILTLFLYPLNGPSAGGWDIQSAWERAREAGAYRFSADVVQTTIPLAKVTNVGRQSREEALHLEGDVNLIAHELDLTLWSQGGSLANAAGGLEVRVEGDQAYARNGGGAWQEIDDFTGLFAPEGDLLAYLSAVRDVVEIGTETRVGVTFSRYGFDIDGRKFAVYVRDQMQQRLAKQGSLPPGLTLDVPHQFAKMSGEGELWVDDQGLPLRQILHLRFPDTADDRLEAEIRVTFSDFGSGEQQARAWSLGSLLPTRRSLPSLVVLSATLALMALIVLHHRSRKVYLVLVVTVILSMICVPLLQSERAVAFAREMETRVQEQEARAEESQMQVDLQAALQTGPESSAPAGPAALDLIRNDDQTDSDGDGLTDVQEVLLETPMFQANDEVEGLDLEPPNIPPDDGEDQDGDGLTDYEEALLGTSRVYTDTDGDLVTDYLEVVGDGNTFAGDPLNWDTNWDGQADGTEWYVNSPDDVQPGDTDGDGVPDFYDRDNDGDGVPDKLDLSPYQTTSPTLTFDGEHPFSLILQHATPGKPTYVEFQLRPTDPEHLWYAYNVLDWPEDRQGWVQDGDNKTYYDVCVAGSENPTKDCASPSPNDQGDIKLLPMLEIRIQGSDDSLPSEQTLRDYYGIFVQPWQGDQEEKSVYVPLQLVTDGTGGQRVGFYGKMFYLPGESWGAAHQVRMVWMVQALLDQCEKREDGQCVRYSAYNSPMTLHTYDDQWVLTGLNVREDHGQDLGVIWEHPDDDADLHRDDTLVRLTAQLDETFLKGRDCDITEDGVCYGNGELDITVPELQQRFALTTTLKPDDDERWGITATTDMTRATYSHQDEGLRTVAMTTTKSILDEAFTSYWSEADPITPTLLYVREERYKATNLDALGKGQGYAWDDGRQLTVDMNAEGIQLTTLAAVNWKPYCYDGLAWAPCAIEDYWEELERRYAGDFDDEDPELAQGKLVLFEYYYLTLYSGVSSAVKQGDQLLQAALTAPEMSSDAQLAQNLIGFTGSATTFITNMLVFKLQVSSQELGTFFTNLATLKGSKTSTLTPPLLKGIRGLSKFARQREWAFLGAQGAALIGIVTLVVGAGLLLATYFADSPGLKIATAVVLGAGLTALQVVRPVITARTLYNLERAGYGGGKSIKAALSTVLRGKSEAIGSTTKASVVGLVISLAVTIGFFVYQLVTLLGGDTNAIQVQMLVAQALAQAVIAVVMFFLGATIIGSIVCAIIAIVDLILSLVGLEEWTSAALLAKAMFGYEEIATPNCAIAKSGMALEPTSRGYVAGNTMVFTAVLSATSTMSDPHDIRAIPYLPTLWTEKQLVDSSVKCDLDPAEADPLAIKGDMKDEWTVKSHHSYLGWNMRQASQPQIRDMAYTLRAGINTTPDLYMNVGYDVPIANCWLIALPPWWYPMLICYPQFLGGATAANLGTSLPVDVFPATLEDFYWLDWDPGFGHQRDHDGDGLIAVAHYGNDPDDHDWDTDNDGLSDTYEVQLRAQGGAEGGMRPSPRSVDTDGDGLSDADEIRLGTFPNLRDSDGDQLEDGQEVLHQECLNGTCTWEGGWVYTYTYTSTLGIPDQERTVVVTSDPLVQDTDDDGLSDAVEHALRTHPRAWTPNPQVLSAEISDDDGIVGPGQTFVYTATVENGIDDTPGWYLWGTMTATLPSVLGGGVPTTTYSIYQGESASLVANVAVPPDALSGTVTIGNEARGWMHDGYMQPTWELTLTEESTRSYMSETYATLAPAPGADDLFAMASVEGAPLLCGQEYPEDDQIVGFRLVNSTIPESTPDIYRELPGPGLRPDEPGLACNEEGRCLVAYASRRARPTRVYLMLDTLDCIKQHDGENISSSVYIKVNGDEVFYVEPVKDNQTYPIGYNVLFDYEAEIEVWEDDQLSKDDSFGKYTQNYWQTCTLSPIFSDKNNYFQLHYSISPSNPSVIRGALMTETGTLSNTIDLGAGGVSRPVVASDGDSFLVAWRKELLQNEPSDPERNGAFYALPVSGDGTADTGQSKRVDYSYLDSELRFGDDHDLALAWAGPVERYLAAWLVSRAEEPETLLIALLDRDGTPVYRTAVTAADNPGPPAVAYNEQTERALLVYPGGLGGVTGRFLDLTGDSVAVGSPITVTVEGLEPSVAYEPKFGGWLVTWVERSDVDDDKLHYLALSADGQPLQHKEGRGPDAVWTELGGSVTVPHLVHQAVACSAETTDFAQCDVGASSLIYLHLQRLDLTQVPSLLGPIWSLFDAEVQIDADPPTSTIKSFADGQTVAISGTITLGGEASDPGSIASGISHVEISTDGGTTWETTNGPDSWVYNWEVPDVDGPATLTTRATDLVGNVETSPQTITVYLDRTPPEVSIDDLGIISATERLPDPWTLALTGNVDDALGDVDWVEVTVTPHGNGSQQAAVSPDGTWSLDYVLSSFDGHGGVLTDPTGRYTVTAVAADVLGNEGSAEPRTIGVDNRPPVALLTDPGPSTAAISTTLTMSGVFTDPGPVSAGLETLELSFTPLGGEPSTWQPVTLAASGPEISATTWSHGVPDGIEGLYQIDLRGHDGLQNRNEDAWAATPWTGEIDTLAPRLAMTMTCRGAGSALQTVYEGRAEDLSLVTDGFQFPCPLQAADRTYYSDPWYIATVSDTTRLVGLAPSCVVNGLEAPPTFQAWDRHDHSAQMTVDPPLCPSLELASTVLDPPHETVLPDRSAVDLTVGAYAQNGLDALTVMVNGTEFTNHTWPASPPVYDTEWSTVWTPSEDGQYRFDTVVGDQLGNVQTDLQPVTITVDAADPTIDLPTPVFTTAHRLSFRRVLLAGTASDNLGLEKVEVAVDGDDWAAASFDGTTWRFPWYLGNGDAEPDGQDYQVSARATDGAGHQVEVDTTVTVDLVPPEPASVTLFHLADPAPLSLQAGDTVHDANPTLAIEWTESSDGSGLAGYLVGWTGDHDPDLGTLSSYGSAEGHEEAFAEPQALYAHVVPRDSHHNARLQTLGPVYVDGPQTPDYVDDLDYHGWLESGCSQVGADREVARNAFSQAYLSAVQRLYLTWDDEALRLAWTGANWNASGDLFLYFDTAAGGASTAYDPYGSGPAVGLPAQDGQPLAADHVLWVEDEHTARLIAWNGSSWDLGSALSLDDEHFRLEAGSGRTDLLIPFDWLGIADPAAATLKLVALASEEEALRIWATMPDKNPLNSEWAVDAAAYGTLDVDFDLTQQYEWTSLGAGLCPNQGQFADADLHVSLRADPPGVEVGFLEHDLPALLPPGTPLDGDLDGQPDVELPLDLQPELVGDGQTITYRLTYTNQGSVEAPGATATLHARGGLQLADGSPQVISLPGMGGTVEIVGTIDAALDGQSAELDAVVADAVHGDFDWLWVQHQVDTEAPEGLAILAPEAYVRPGRNLASGTVSDPSGVPLVELDIQPGGVVSCPDETPMDDGWVCVWDAGQAGDGDQFQLSARATDRFGNRSGWVGPQVITVDATAPAVSLSAESEAALADGQLTPAELTLSGQVSDERQAHAVRLCAAPAGQEEGLCEVHLVEAGVPPTSADWSARAPVSGDSDGELQDLTFYGVDSVGNLSTSPLIRTVWVDVVAPTVVISKALETAEQAVPTVVLEGSIRDGTGVESLVAVVYKPDGNIEWLPIAADGSSWAVRTAFAQAGRHRLVLQAVDEAGNERRVGPFELMIYEADSTADMALALAVSSDPAITSFPLTYTCTISNYGLGPANATYLTLTLPSQVELPSVPAECTEVASGQLACELAGLPKDDVLDFDIQVYLPLEAMGSLVFEGEVASDRYDTVPENNRPEPLISALIQPISGLAATSNSPTPLGMTTTLTASLETGTGVQFRWDYGDGQTGTGRVTGHVYPPGEDYAATYPVLGTYTATVTGQNLYNQAVATTVVEVYNVEPVLYTEGHDQVVFEDEPVTLGSVHFADPNRPDTHIARIDWGDGSVTDPAGIEYRYPYGFVLGSHTYPNPGVYTVTITVEDAYGGVGSGSLIVTVVHGFVRTCAYAFGYPPGLAANHGASLHCPWVPCGEAGTFCASGIGSRGGLVLKKRAILTGELLSSDDGVELGAGALLPGSWMQIEANDEISAPADVSSEGKVVVKEESAVAGSIIARDDVWLEAATNVRNNVLASGEVRLDPTAIVQGTVTEMADVQPFPSITPVELALSAGKKNVSVKEGKVKALDPGSYQRLKVSENATLQLRAGSYAFEKINVSPGARIEFDLSAGAVVVDVVESIQFGEYMVMAITSEVGDAAGILFRATGNVVMLKEGGTFLGTYLAPNAVIQLGTGATLFGALYGQTVDLGNQARVVGMPARDVFASLFVNPNLVYAPESRLGTLFVQKLTYPSPDPTGTGFEFSAVGTKPETFWLQDGQTQIFSRLTPGTYGLAEWVPEDWELSSATCSDGSDPASISLESGEWVVCTFANRWLTPPGTIVVEKVTDPTPDPAGTAFEFSARDLELPSFWLQDGGSLTFSNLVSGTYGVTETVPTGWTLTAACSDGSHPEAIALEFGETVTCTFTNTLAPPAARLVIEKVTDPTPDPTGTAFEFTAPGLDPASFWLMDGGSWSFSDLISGTYGLTETMLAGWTLTAACSDGSEPEAISLEAGETVTCTFTNTLAPPAARLVIEKVTDPSPDPSGTAFEFAAPGLDPASFWLLDGGSLTFSDLVSGTYSVTETMLAGWTLTALCSDGSDPGAISLEASETVTCTFTNTLTPPAARLVIEKVTDPTPDPTGTAFEFAAPGLDPASFWLLDGGSLTFSDLISGTYAVTETVAAGWTLTALCSDGSDPESISLEAGETVTCTFTNLAAGP